LIFAETISREVSQAKNLVNVFGAKALEWGKGHSIIDIAAGGIHASADAGSSVPLAKGKKRQREGGGGYCNHSSIPGILADTSSAITVSYPGGLATD